MSGGEVSGSEVSGSDDLQAALAAFEGRQVGPPFLAPDPVNQPMIRHWVEAMGDENPVYVDEAAARAVGFPGVIAPPTMLQAWIMRGYKATAELEAARAAGRTPDAASAQDELLALLDAAGFTSVVATNCEQRYVRPLVLGDRLTATSVIESVSPQKSTALGDGHFVTTRTDFTDQHGEHVATMRFRILKFRPRSQLAAAGASDGATAGASPPHGTAPAPQAPPPQGTASAAQAPSPQGSSAAPPPTPPATSSVPSRRPRPAISRDIAFFFDGARQGKLLVQRCVSCGRLRHPPLPACPSCRSMDWDTIEASGRGTVYSFVVVHHPQVPGFEYPLPIALVELEEGTRIVADLVGVDPAAVRIGMPVACEMLAVDDELTLPVFRPVAAGASTGGA